MKYLVLLGNPKSLVLLVHPLFRPRWIDAIDRGLTRLLRGTRQAFSAELGPRNAWLD